MNWLLLLAAILLAICIAVGVVFFVRRRRAVSHTHAGAAPPERRGPGPLGIALLGALLIAAIGGGYLILNWARAGTTDQFVVLITPFDDGGNGQTGQNTATELASALRDQAGGTIRVIIAEERPASPDAALALAEAQSADLLIYGAVAPGAILDSASLSPRLIYTPNGSYAPNAWDGYLGRFSMPRSFVLSSAPVNGKAVLAPLIGALADYSRGEIDRAFLSLSRLSGDYPELLPALPQAIRGNIFWARGLFPQAAEAYRLALSQPADDQALLSTNLGVILLDAGDPASRDAFSQAVTQLQGRDLGELRANLGILALREQRPRDAVVAFEQARNLLGPNTPLLLSLTAAYRDSGRLGDAASALDSADAQLDRDMDRVPASLRVMYRERSNAAINEQRALLKLAESLKTTGPLFWEIELGPVGRLNELTGLRNMLRSAASTSDSEIVRWRQLAASDAAAEPGTGDTATGQAERAEQNALRQRYHQAVLESEISRARRGRPSDSFSRLLGALFGSNSPTGNTIALLQEIDQRRPDDPAVVTALGRALRLDGQFDAANQTYDRLIAFAAQRPEGYFGKGQVALDRGDRDAAVQLFQAAIERDGSFFPARDGIAMIAEDRGDWAAAIVQRRAVAEQYPNPVHSVALAMDLRKSGPDNYYAAQELLRPLSTQDVDAAIELARVYNDAGKPDAAIQAYRDALTVDPRSSTAAFELGETLARQGQLEEAETQLRNALRYDESNIDARLALAQLYQGPLDRPDEAIQQFNSLLRQGVRSYDQLIAIGDAALAYGESEQAITAYERARQERPTDAQLLHRLGAAYIAADRLSAATEVEQEVLQNAAPDAVALRAEALIRLGDISQREGNPGAATDFYNQALQIDPQSIPARLGLGQLAVAQSQWGVALGYFEAAASQPGGEANALAQFWLGEGLLHSGSLDRAATAYQRALSVEKEFPEALLGLAQLRYGQGDREAARTTVEEALTQRPVYAEALLFRGKLLQEQNDFEGAFNAYDQSIKANTNIPETFYRRGLIYMRNEDYNAAVRDFSRATQLQANFPEAHYWLGRAYYAQGRLQGALEGFERAVSYSGGFVDAIFYSGLAAEDLGNIPEAITAYQRVIELDSAEWAARARAQLERIQ